MNYENSVMGQPARYSESTMSSFGETLRQRIHSAKAVDKLNAAIAGEPITMVQFNSIRLAIDKCLPSLAAIMVEIKDDRPRTIHDLNAELLASGLDALDTGPQLIESTVEKVEAVQENSQGGGCPEASE
jgi:hypothetical protein